MSFTLKLLVLGGIILGDLLALAIITPKMIRKGQTMLVPIVGTSMIVTTVVVAWVLFSFVD